MIWYDIPEFPNHLISKDCVIRKRELVGKGNGRVILSQTSDGNYLGVKIKHESGVWKRRHVHVLMMKVFIGPRPDGMVINHIDGDKHNNRLDNLEYCTQKENEHHSLSILGKTHTRGPDGRFISTTTTERVV